MKIFKSEGYPYHRGRRLRIHDKFRDLVSESSLSSDDLVMPYFIREEDEKPLIKQMNGIKRFTIKELIIEIKKVLDCGIKAIAIFPKVADEKKSLDAKESFNTNNLVCRCLRSLNSKFPDLIVICDIALDAYTLSGHDGIINSSGSIDNDMTIQALSEMSLNFAESGCKIIAPSDMMDGRIKIIRETLEKRGYKDTIILSYSSKFCSNFYSPFRDALGSKKKLGNNKKSSYQIDYRNSREAIKESLEDIQEGADVLMVKPAGYYLDIIKELRQNCLVPIAAYQVSGEYCLIKNASENGLINFKDSVIESLYCIKRSGADMIFSYFASEVAQWLKK